MKWIHGRRPMDASGTKKALIAWEWLCFLEHESVVPVTEAKPAEPGRARKTKKADPARPDRPLDLSPATTYVPTQLPVQYHRPCEA
jgi:hypothetical protein